MTRIRIRAQGAAIALSAVIAYLVVSTLLYLVIKDSVITAMITNTVTVVAVIAWRIRARDCADSVVIHKPYTWLELVFLPTAAIVVSRTATEIGIYVKTHISNSAGNEQALTNTPMILLIMLGLVFAPLGEEALIRGFVYPVLRHGFSAPTTILVTTAVFALLHGNLAQIVLTIPLGIILGCIYERTHRLDLCVGVHALFNIMAMVTPTEKILAIGSGPIEALILTIIFVLISVCFTILGSMGCINDDEKQKEKIS